MVAFAKPHRKAHTPDRSAKDSGLRFYSAESSRWLNRDPIGEQGSSIYIFCRNDAVGQVDHLGLISIPTLSISQSVAGSGTICFPIGGSWGIIFTASIGITAHACYDAATSTHKGYTELSGSASLGVYAVTCTTGFSPSGATGGTASPSCDPCPASQTATWGFDGITIAATAGGANASCTVNSSGSVSCSVSIDWGSIANPTLNVTLTGSASFTAVLF